MGQVLKPVGHAHQTFPPVKLHNTCFCDKVDTDLDMTLTLGAKSFKLKHVKIVLKYGALKT